MCLFAAAAIPATAQAQESDLLVTKSGPSTAAADTDVAFTITVTNLGPDDAGGVTLDDPIIGGWSFVSVNQNNGPTFTCTDPGTGATSGSVNCTLALMTSGTSATFTLTMHIPPATPPGTFFTNVATVSTQTFDPNDENNSATATVSTPPPPQADLGLLKDGPSIASPDTDVTYTITLTNSGPDAAANVSLGDTLPGTMTFVSFMQNSGPTLVCTPGQTTTCTSASFPAGATAVFTLVGHIPPGTPSGTSFQNMVSVKTDTPDPNSENDSASTLLVVSTADLSINKTGPATANAGQQVSYTITLTNNGPDPSSNASFSDPLPAGSTFVSLIQNTGPTATCTTPIVGTNGTVTCAFGTFFNGANAQFTLTTNIGFGPTVNNTATAAGDGDPNSGNNSSTASTAVTTNVDLAVTKTGPATAGNGANVQYAITVTNNGPSIAPNVTLTDAIPAGTTFNSFSQQTGPTFTCSAPPVNCTIATLASGATATFQLNVTVNQATTPGTVISNTAIVSSSGTETNPGNNSSTANTTATATATDVAITKTAPPAFYATGFPVTWNITVTNNGPATAFNVVVTDPLVGNTLVNASSSQGSCSGTTTVTCNVGTLAVGATATITIQATIGSTPGAVSNTATVTETNVDTNPANNSSTAAITAIDAALIPALSPFALALLGMAMAAVAVFAMRR